MGLLDRAVKVGFDDVAIEIADDEHGRIKERLAVAQELLVGLVEVLLHALVFPAETALLPHVGEATFGRVTRIGHFEKLHVFDDALLVAEGITACGVRLSRSWLTPQPAKIVKVPLVRGRFLAPVPPPLLLKLCDCHLDFTQKGAWLSGSLS